MKKPFLVIRPVLAMRAELVYAETEHEAKIKVSQGKGNFLYDTRHEPSTVYENMTVSPIPTLDPNKDGQIFAVERGERYTQELRVMAKNEKEAREMVKDGLGFPVGNPDFDALVDINNSNVYLVDDNGKKVQ